MLTKCLRKNVGESLPKCSCYSAGVDPSASFQWSLEPVDLDGLIAVIHGPTSFCGLLQNHELLATICGFLAKCGILP